MGSIRIRYVSDDEDQWELHDAMDVGELARKFASASSDSMMSFGS